MSRLPGAVRGGSSGSSSTGRCSPSIRRLSRGRGGSPPMARRTSSSARSACFTSVAGTGWPDARQPGPRGPARARLPGRPRASRSCDGSCRWPCVEPRHGSPAQPPARTTYCTGGSRSGSVIRRVWSTIPRTSGASAGTNYPAATTTRIRSSPSRTGDAGCSWRTTRTRAARRGSRAASWARMARSARSGKSCAPMGTCPIR